jgi:hypothetical protein
MAIAYPLALLRFKSPYYERGFCNNSTLNFTGVCLKDEGTGDIFNYIDFWEPYAGERARIPLGSVFYLAVV